MQYKEACKSPKYESERSYNNDVKLKKKITVKNRNMRKAKSFCNVCWCEFDNSNMFFKHFRLKHREIAVVSSCFLNIS